MERHMCLKELRGKGNEIPLKICSRKPSLEFFDIFFVFWEINHFFFFLGTQ